MLMKKIYLDYIDVFEIHRFEFNEDKNELKFLTSPTGNIITVNFDKEKDLVAAIVFVGDSEYGVYRENPVNSKDIDMIKGIMTEGISYYHTKGLMKLKSFIEKHLQEKYTTINMILDSIVEFAPEALSYFSFSRQDIEYCYRTGIWTLENIKRRENE